MLLGVLGLVLLLGVAIALQVRVGLRPLRGLLDDLGQVWQGRRHRVDEALPRELAPLAAAVNQLLNHDDREIVRARDQAADLAHAIKTPLAVLRSDLEGLDPLVAAGMRERVDLIDGLARRNLARAAPGRGGAQNALGAPVRPVAEQMVELMPRVHLERSVQALLAVPDEIYVRLDRQDLEELLGNLLDNAWKWAQGRVRVSAWARAWACPLHETSSPRPAAPWCWTAATWAVWPCASSCRSRGRSEPAPGGRPAAWQAAPPSPARVYCTEGASGRLSSRFCGLTRRIRSPEAIRPR